jgi:hypothetical protein
MWTRFLDVTVDVDVLLFSGLLSSQAESELVEISMAHF